MKIIPILLMICNFTFGGCVKVSLDSCPTKAVIEGDSYSATGSKWPLFLKDSSSYFHNITQVNYAVSGQQAYQMQSQYSTEAHTSKPNRGEDYWFFIYAGINDLAGANRPADTVFAALKSIWANARNDGYRVVAFTVIHSLTLSAGKEAERVKLNNYILANPTLYDYLVNVASNFDPRTQPELFIDDTHLTTAGFRMFAGIVATTLQPYTNQPCRPIYFPIK